MKFSLCFLTFGLASAAKRATKVDNVAVNSPLGAKLIENARRLENDAEVDFTWVANFSIKFQGCHHVSQWNEDADDEEDVRIQTKRLIRFRLCPTDTCSLSSASGCKEGYGDYIIDMNTFLESYFDAVDDYNEYRCEYTKEMVCNCDDDDNKGDDFDADICEYDCYVANGIEDICADGNPYEEDGQDEQEEQFDLKDAVECQQANFDQNNRKLEEQEVEYYMGPYCAEQGGAIYLGLFTDDTCTTFADDNGGSSTYSYMAGRSLPYSDDSLISMDCMSCKEPAEYNNEGNDAYDEDEVIEMCEQIYQTAGKCESALAASGYVYEPNENACNYIAGIKVVRKDGIITQVGSKANKTASIFIGIFVVAFVLLAAYVYYLKTKLDRASINLSD